MPEEAQKNGQEANTVEEVQLKLKVQHIEDDMGTLKRELKRLRQLRHDDSQVANLNTITQTNILKTVDDIGKHLTQLHEILTGPLARPQEGLISKLIGVANRTDQFDQMAKEITTVKSSVDQMELFLNGLKRVAWLAVGTFLASCGTLAAGIILVIMKSK